MFLQVLRTVVEGTVSILFSRCFTSAPKLDLSRSYCFLDLALVFSTVQANLNVVLSKMKGYRPMTPASQREMIGKRDGLGKEK